MDDYTLSSTGAQVDAAAQQAAATADYVVEQGTSGIWTYRKWNSGIAEIWGFFDQVAINSGYISVAYPSGFAFTAEPTVNATAWYGSAEPRTAKVLFITTSNALDRCALYLREADWTLPTGTFSANVVAIGRWK